MPIAIPDRYINLLTDFGFKRVFGSEANKQLAIAFLNTLLPQQHQIQDLTFKNPENFGSTILDRKAVFDVYCQAQAGQRFIVEIQKARQDYFKDRSVYYSTFPIQEQALKGPWNFRLDAVYTVGVLDFVFDDHKKDAELIHTVQLKDQKCQVFYDKLNFIYIELPKFKKTLSELESPLDKWLFLLRHLSELEQRPEFLQDEELTPLFEVAEVANFSPVEQMSYRNSLKEYRDLTNVVDSSERKGWRQGHEKGLEEGLALGRQEGEVLGQRKLLLHQLSRKFGVLPDEVEAQVGELTEADLDMLGEMFFELETVAALAAWLGECLGGVEAGS
ncbi:MAG: Rpn family recombination-promoting nuclease/putative transposase [Spirulina sp. SIO3F2]|nr:Rpn family recombination-promoting nuclease/putative transposase [Spirulina sp. SIO3F2]